VGDRLVAVLLVCSGCGSDAGQLPTDVAEDLAAGSTAIVEPAVAAPYRIEPDPPLDGSLSPVTGWGRAHYEALFGRLCRGLVAHLTPGGARAVYGGDEGTGAIEGVTRMLPVIGAWLADPANSSVIEYDGDVIDLVAVARAAVLHGTDPEHEDFWGEIGGGTDQRNVEVASVAEFLLLSRARVWAAMSRTERDRIMTWLREGTDAHASNRALFGAVRNTARRVLGYPADPGVIGAYLDQADEYFLGDGWYADGPNAKIDWYAGFVFHPELLFWVWADGGSDPGRAARIVARARAYLHHLPHFFDDRGGHVAFGRSLAYRSAMLAPIALAELLGVSPLDRGRARRLVSASLAHFLAGGPGATTGMLDERDVLRRGYLGDDPRVCESYIRSGSTYYTARSLLLLALPRDHAFWTAPERAGFDVGEDRDHVLPGPGFSLHRHADATSISLTRSWNSDGPSHAGKYGRLAYSSQFFVNETGPSGDELVDAGVSVAEFGRPMPRGAPQAGEVAHGFAYTRFDASGAWTRYGVDSASIFVRDGLVRVSCVDPPSGPPAFEFVEASHYLGGAEPVVTAAPDHSWEHAESERGWIFTRRLLGHDWAPGFVAAAAVNVVFDDGGQILSTAPGMAAGPNCSATAQLAGLEPADLGDLVERGFSVEATEDPREFVLAGPQGERAFVSLRPAPSEQTVILNGRSLTGPIRFARVSADGRSIEGLHVREVGGAATNQPLLTADAPRLVRLQARRSGVWRVELDGAAELRAPGGPPIAVVTLDVDDQRVDITDEVVQTDGAARISDELHAEWSLARGVSLMRLELETGG
jgi:hypothetical protein